MQPIPTLDYNIIKRRIASQKFIEQAMRYWFLLILYMMVVLLYAGHASPVSTLAVWPALRQDTGSAAAANTTCQQTSDCAAHHICIHDTCYPQLLRGEECDSETGEWTLTAHRGIRFAACLCRQPHLVTQKHFGGNCTVDVACRPYGHYNVQQHKCECSEGYVALKNPDPICQKMLAMERLAYEPCEADEVTLDEIRDEDGFASDYLEKHKDKKCFKRPCTFDAITGRPLKRARYEPTVGCICDPSLGQFGVRIPSNHMEYDPGYNACVSIFETPLEEPIDVDVVTYFYLMTQAPVSYLQFKDLKVNEVIAPLRSALKDGALQIGQEFPYDYMQAHFRQDEPFHARLRKRKLRNLFFTDALHYWEEVPHSTVECHLITQLMGADLYRKHTFADAYHLLYAYPVCRVDKNHLESPNQYRGQFVLNPMQLTYREFPDETRYNGLMLSYQKGRWLLQFAEPYRIDQYIPLANKDMVPIIKTG